VSRRDLFERSARVITSVADTIGASLVRTKAHIESEQVLREDAAALTALAGAELPPETVSAIREWLDGSSVELADDAIAKLTDAKGRPFAHVTAGFLRSLPEIGIVHDGPPCALPTRKSK
jgi:hypothetical protein